MVFCDTFAGPCRPSVSSGSLKCCWLIISTDVGFMPLSSTVHVSFPSILQLPSDVPVKHSAENRLTEMKQTREGWSSLESFSFTHWDSSLLCPAENASTSNRAGLQNGGGRDWGVIMVDSGGAALLQLCELQSETLGVSSGWTRWATASGCYDRWSRSSPCRSKTWKEAAVSEG